MGYKIIRFAGFSSGIISAILVLGAVVQTFGPWARPSGQRVDVIWMFGWIGFSIVSTVATNVVKILETQADQIADLQRQLAERPQPAGAA